MGKFKVGDRVRVIAREIFCDRVQVGDEAVVQNVVEGPLSPYLALLFDGDLPQSCLGHHIELIEPDAATANNWDFDPRRELKVGDRVRALIDDHYRGFKAGDTFVISGVEGECIRFLDNDGDGRLRSISDFELIPPSDPDPDLSVRVVADMSQLDDEIDRILRRLKKVEKKARKLGIRLEFRGAA